MKRTYDWKPAMKDHRVKKYKQKALELPPSVDLRDKCPPVYNQGQMGACSGNALAGTLSYLKKQAGIGFNPSRLFIYWNERAVEGDPHVDAGATTLKDGCESLINKGAPEEISWPYDERNLLTRPTPAAYGDAFHHKISGYASLSTLDDMLNALAQEVPFPFGFPVYESFESPEVAQTGIVPYPGYSEQCIGGHAVMAVGYDLSKSQLLVRNSWGTDWGQDGYFWMPFRYVTDLADDFYTLRL